MIFRQFASVACCVLSFMLAQKRGLRIFCKIMAKIDFSVRQTKRMGLILL